MAKIHQWTLNEAAGNYLDSVGSDDGVPTSIDRVPGLFGNAALLNASGDKIAITSRPSDLDFTTGDWTVSGWFKTTVSSLAYQAIYTRGWSTAGIWIGLEPTNAYPDVHCHSGGSSSNVLDGSALAPYALNDGFWHQMVITKLGTVWRCYIDGALVMENLAGPGTLTSSAAFDPLIGNSGVDQYFEGTLDNVEIWSNALLAADVAAMYYQSLSTISIANQDPAPLQLYAPSNTSVDFDIEDTTNQALESTLEVTIDGILAYDGDGGDFQPGYSGTVTTVGNNIECSISKLGGFAYDLDGHSVHVYCENDAAGVLSTTYYFGTTVTTQGIYPQSPYEFSAQFEDENVPIIVDFYTNIPTQVRVDRGAGWEVVWNGAFQFPWTGVYIAEPTKNFWRLVLDADVAYSIGQIVRVEVSAPPFAKTYSFRIAVKQHTSTNDVTSPQIIQAAAFIHAGYSRSNDGAGLPPANFEGPGNIYMLTVSPLTGEVLVVPGNEISLTYDSTLSKVIIYFVRNGTVFYMTMDPADVATTQSIPRSLESLYRLGVGGEGSWQHWTDTSYPPIKAPIYDTYDLGVGGQGGWINFYSSPYDRAPTPRVISGALSDTTVELRIEQPTGTRERELIIGYFIVKWTNHTPNEVGFVPFSPGDAYAVWTDPVLQPGTEYSVVPLYYRLEGRSETIKGITGSRATIEPFSIHDEMTLGVGGEGNWQYWVEETFTPLKIPNADTMRLGAGGEGSWIYWEDSSFKPIGT